MAETGDHAHSHRVVLVHRHRDVTGGAARAAIFGISDGLVSNVALVLGVAAAAAERSNVLVAGVAGLLAGSASMAAGEYVSMRAQAELVERELEIERRSLTHQPDIEIRELTSIYRARGVDESAARQMAEAVMADPDLALEVHAREELGVHPGGVGNPTAAAVSSFVAFAIGAVLPLIPWFIVEGNGAVVASLLIGLIAAAGVGAVLAVFTERSIVTTALRQVGWAAGACGVTWLVGSLLGAAVT